MRRNICVIDDDPDLREIVASAIEYEGIETHTFENPLKFEEYLNHTVLKDWPCLVLIDYFMPEMDGVTFINYFRDKYKNLESNISFALSTAHKMHDKNEIPTGVLLLQKPYDLGDLIQVANHFANS